MEDGLEQAVADSDDDINAFLGIQATTENAVLLAIPGPWPARVDFYMDIRKGTCVRADETSDFLS